MHDPRLREMPLEEARRLTRRGEHGAALGLLVDGGIEVTYSNGSRRCSLSLFQLLESLTDRPVNVSSPLWIPLQWGAREARLFACDCAQRVLHMFEGVHPDDRRPRSAIETARLYALGNSSDAHLEKAWDSAWNAVLGELDTGAKMAAKAATRAASESMNWAAAETAKYAAFSVQTKGAAAGSDERQWQMERLLQYLTSEVSQTCLLEWKA